MYVAYADFNELFPSGRRKSAANETAAINFIQVFTIFHAVVIAYKALFLFVSCVCNAYKALFSFTSCVCNAYKVLFSFASCVCNAYKALFSFTLCVCNAYKALFSFTSCVCNAYKTLFLFASCVCNILFLYNFEPLIVRKIMRSYSDDLQHKGAMSTKTVFEKIVKIQRLYVHYVDVRHLCF